ncbi:MAG TPA: hypothetical protein ENN35_07530 [Deltaproteobacteria bacterium]|nr:hypothetical protein [Deltaproteobacteria bacterium]
MRKKTTILAEGLAFPEGPRWREDQLWFSDMNRGLVMTVDETGVLNTVLHVPGSPSGLGWLPDGRLLVVSMIDRRLLRLDAGGPVEVADLFDLASYHLNDMVVDDRGRAYIGNFGFDLTIPEPFSPAEIIMVEPDGTARVAAKDMAFPNGTVITPDGRTLIVAETFGRRLTAFTREEDGSLVDRRLWADVAPATPDGICLDRDDAIWVASPETAEVVRVAPGGVITDRVEVSTRPYACMLGGTDRRTLFVCTSGAGPFDGGRIEVVEVEVPGTGFP